MSAPDQGEWLYTYPGCATNVKKPQCPLIRRLCGLQIWSEQFEEEKTLLPLLGIEPLIIQLVS